MTSISTGPRTRERGDADRGTRVSPRGPEDVDQHLARAVDDRRLLVEVAGAGDEARDGENALDAVEGAELGPQQ